MFFWYNLDMQYTARITQTKKLLDESSVDSLFLTDFTSILYLTGFKTLSPHEMEAKMIVTATKSYLITDSRYEHEAHEYFSDHDNITVCIQTPEMTFIQILTEIIGDCNIEKVGFESHHLTFMWFEHLQKNLKDVTWKPLPFPLMKMRDVKDAKELELMRKAASLTDKCLNSIIPLLKVGNTERQVVEAMEDWIRARGLQFSFDPIVAVDDHAALPHYNNKQSDGTFKEGSIILIDMGVSYEDYCADITRMFFIGKPSTDIEKAYYDLLNIQKKTVELVEIGKTGEEIDTVAREGLISLGYPPIPHSTGHGLGLEVHEGVRISKGVKDTIKEGMVFTIEPGIYYPGKWGMRIEDTVAIVDSKVEILTKFPKEFIVR